MFGLEGNEVDREAFSPLANGVNPVTGWQRPIVEPKLICSIAMPKSMSWLRTKIKEFTPGLDADLGDDRFAHGGEFDGGRISFPEIDDPMTFETAI